MKTNFKTRKSDRQGFTLVELLVVVTILGMLAAIAAPQVMKHLGRAKIQTAHVEIKNIETALDLFKMDVGRYPKEDEGLNALLKQPNGLDTWKGPYLDKQSDLNDPWGEAYIYHMPGQHGEYDLLSHGGADKSEGGNGEKTDITSWQ